jgi:hypothetical protein
MTATVKSDPQPSLEELLLPLLAGSAGSPCADTPLSAQPAGDFAVLAWLDDLQARYSTGPYTAEVAAELIARWDSVSPREVHALLFGDGTGRDGRS